MRSKTKYKLDNSTLARLYKAVGFPDAGNIRPLGAGEFNAVFVADAGGKEVVIKIAPGSDAPILQYEKGMMESELYWYGRLAENTDIRLPEIYYKDMSKAALPTGFFFMEKLPGQTLTGLKPNKEERTFASAEIARIAAKMHKIKGVDGFGYRQQKLYPDWYAAIRGMTQSLVSDAGRRGKRSKRGERLIRYIDKYKDILIKAPCRMVNFDLWDLNFLCTRSPSGLNMALIDPERCFWGDPIADFVCLELMKPLREKTASIAAYNEIAETKIARTRDEETRYAVALAYLGVLMETEKYFRYSPVRFGWWRNVLASKILISKAFKLLDE